MTMIQKTLLVTVLGLLLGPAMAAEAATDGAPGPKDAAQVPSAVLPDGLLIAAGESGIRIQAQQTVSRITGIRTTTTTRFLTPPTPSRRTRRNR